MAQVRYPFNGELNQNVITSALYNMIISQRVFDSKVASTELADMFKTDGTLFGDTKLYHSFDIGSPENWLNDAEAGNLLQLNRNKSGKTQAIVMGIYKIISITIDQYLSKNAFMKEGAFAEYTSFLTGSLRKIKRVYDRSLINSKLGTLSGSTNRCNITVTSPKGATVEEQNRLQAQFLAQAFEVLIADLEDNNRDFNELGYLRSYSADEFVAVWNVKVASKITKVDIPSLFHKDINNDGGFRKYVLPEKWFGNAGADETLTIATVKAAGNDLRIIESGWYNVRPSTGTDITLVDKPDNNSVFLWAGDIVPSAGVTITDSVRGVSVTTTATTINGLLTYIVDSTVACVLVHKEALPFMSGFETGTEFWNARSLTSNHYLIFGHNYLEFLKEYPRIKVKVAISDDGAQPIPVEVVNTESNPVLTQGVTP